MTGASIHEACRRGDIDAVRSLLATDPAAVDIDDEHAWRPIFHAALYRHQAVVRLLIESGADLAAHDGYVMRYAGEVRDNKAIVSLLVQYGALDAHVRPTDDPTRQFLAAVVASSRRDVTTARRKFWNSKVYRSGTGHWMSCRWDEATTTQEQ